MDHFVKLERLPDDLKLPRQLSDQFSYDEARRGLVYRGAMSRATFEVLWNLHTNTDYRRAIEELFRVATYTVEGGRSSDTRLRMLVALFFVSALIIGVLAVFIILGQ